MPIKASQRGLDASNKSTRLRGFLRPARITKRSSLRQTSPLRISASTLPKAIGVERHSSSEVKFFGSLSFCDLVALIELSVSVFESRCESPLHARCACCLLGAQPACRVLSRLVFPPFTYPTSNNDLAMEQVWPFVAHIACERGRSRIL